MQLFLSTISLAAWLFLSGALVFAVLLPKWFQTHFNQVARDAKDFKFVAVLSEKILQGLGITLLVQWTSIPAIHLIAIPLLLISCTYLLSTYSSYNVQWQPVIVIALIDAVRVVVALVIAAMILRHGIFNDHAG